MKLKYLYILVCCSSFVFGQQIPQFSQYSRNQYLINPAAAGIYDFTDISMVGRTQWTGFNNSPMSSIISITTPALNSHKGGYYNPGVRTGSGNAHPEVGTGKMKHALGGQLIGDQYGAFRKVKANFTYAIHLPMTRKINFSFGANLGFSNNTFIKERAEVLDPAMDNSYTRFVSGSTNKSNLDLGVGLYLYSKQFYFGLAADQLTKNMISFGSSEVNFNQKMYFNAIGGIRLKLTDDITLNPSFLVKYMNPAPLSVDISVQADYQKFVWAGISYRNSNALVGMVGVNLSKKFKLGYSYDMNISRSNYIKKGSHELVIGIMLR